jgi:ParB-like chromosome segregation protein Spo0J
MFPLMEGDEFDELAGDIQRRGQHFDIVTFDGQIIDGRNRARACQKLGIEPRYTPFQGKAEDVPRFVISANIHRRHLKPEQRRDLIKRVLRLDPTRSDRAIGAELKVDKNVITKTRKQMEATGAVAPVEKRTGRDGKTRRQPVPKLKLAAVPKPDVERTCEVMAPDEELLLWREFGRFVIERKLVVDLVDRTEWKSLLGRAKAMLRATPPPRVNGAVTQAATGAL